jgi:hypothetical protein
LQTRARVYDPHLFDNPNRPIVYRPERKLPAPGWNQADQFRLGHARFYDYVLVQGLARDPFVHDPTAGGVVRPVTDSGIWRLYQVLPEARERRAFTH